MNAPLSNPSAAVKALVIAGEAHLTRFDGGGMPESGSRTPFEEPGELSQALRGLGAAVSLICPQEFGRAQKALRNDLRNQGIRVYTYDSRPLGPLEPEGLAALSTSGQRAHEGLLVSVPDQYTVEHALKRCNAVATLLEAPQAECVDMTRYVLALPSAWRRFVAIACFEGVLPEPGVADLMLLDERTAWRAAGDGTGVDSLGEPLLKAIFRRFKTRYIAVIGPGGEVHVMQSGRKYLPSPMLGRANTQGFRMKVFAALTVAVQTGGNNLRSVVEALGPGA